MDGDVGWHTPGMQCDVGWHVGWPYRHSVKAHKLELAHGLNPPWNEIQDTRS